MHKKVLDSCPNFRQLGGYLSSSGGKIRNQAIFRSGELSNLSDGDVHRLESLKLTHIVDLRRRSEIQARPNRLSPALLDRQQQISIAPGQLGDVLKSTSIEAVDRYMSQINANLALQQSDSFGRFLDLMLDVGKGNVLFHCAAGKDRTGFAAALILMALDVRREIIMEDYLLSSDYFVPEQQADQFLAGQLAEQEASATRRDIMIAVLSTKRMYLKAAFDAIDENFDSTGDYLSEVFEFGPEKQARLQRNFLE